jgi:hypothetical protein
MKALNLKNRSSKKMQQEEISKREGGFWDAPKDIFQTLGLKHELYFAGKLNGNSCQ